MTDAEDDRRRRLAEQGHDPDSRVRFAPGSFGCHELLDRTSLLATSLEEWVLSHPSCLHHADWFALARQAADALEELYRRVGEAHLVGPEPRGHDESV